MCEYQRADLWSSTSSYQPQQHLTQVLIVLKRQTEEAGSDKLVSTSASDHL